MVAPIENTIFNHGTRRPNPNYVVPGAYCERYHYPSAAGSSQSSSCPTRYPPYDQHPYLNGANTVRPQAENCRFSFKRKAVTLHPAYPNDYGYSYAGSSTTYSDPRNNFSLKPEPGFCLSHPLSYASTEFLYGGEQRNVRSRNGDAPHNPAWQAFSSNPPHQLCSSAINFSPSAVEHGGHPLPRSGPQRIHSMSVNYSSNMTNQSVSRNVSTCGNTGHRGALHYSLSPTFHASMLHGTGAGPSRYSHRQIPPRTSPSYPYAGVSTSAFKDAAPLGLGPPPLGLGPHQLPRNPRPLNLAGALRIVSNEAQPPFNEENTHGRWLSQVSDRTDVSPYFNQLDLFDEHRDLRLDIDTMSYEELLALEERIGNVNTGLSEDHLPACLTVSAYCSSTRVREDQSDASCPICLEEYKDKDNLGTMKCLHTYHVSCIKDWLRIKKACPICKASAMDDS